MRTIAPRKRRASLTVGEKEGLEHEDRNDHAGLSGSVCAVPLPGLPPGSGGKGTMRRGLPALAALGLALLLCLGFALTLPLGGGGETAAPQLRSMAAQPEEILVGGDADTDRTPLELLPGEVLDLNSATAKELQKLPGIGEKLAQAIVDFREQNGPFQTVEDLLQVPGIGEKRLAAIRDLVTTEK